MMYCKSCTLVYNISRTPYLYQVLCVVSIYCTVTVKLVSKKYRVTPSKDIFTDFANFSHTTRTYYCARSTVERKEYLFIVPS